jgi:predicted nucleotidyltransferase
VCRRRGVDTLYLFGSRADDGQRVLAGEPVDGQGSDLDVGVYFSPAVRDR